MYIYSALPNLGYSTNIRTLHVLEGIVVTQQYLEPAV